MRPMSRQNDDGTPHFAYFDVATQLSFIWDGRSDHIEVSFGGYGEPIIDLYRPGSLRSDIPTTSINWLDWFASVCQTYISTWKE